MTATRLIKEFLRNSDDWQSLEAIRIHLNEHNKFLTDGSFCFIRYQMCNYENPSFEHRRENKLAFYRYKYSEYEKLSSLLPKIHTFDRSANLWADDSELSAGGVIVSPGNTIKVPFKNFGSVFQILSFNSHKDRWIEKFLKSRKSLCPVKPKLG